MIIPHDENDDLCECQRCYPHDEDDERCDCSECLAEAEEDEDDEDDEDGEDGEDKHLEGCDCDECAHLQLVGLVTACGDDDPLDYLETYGTRGLVEIGKDVLAGGPLDALEEHRPSEDELQAMQACAFGASLSNERRNLLHRVNFQHPDLVTSSDLFRFEPVLTVKGRALLVTLGLLPAKPGEVTP